MTAEKRKVYKVECFKVGMERRHTTKPTTERLTENAQHNTNQKNHIPQKPEMATMGEQKQHNGKNTIQRTRDKS